MPGPMSLAMNDPQAATDLGMAFLQSGKVKPEEVHAAMSMMTPSSGEEPQEDVLTSIIKGKTPAVKSFQNKKESKTTTEDKLLKTRNTYLDPESYAGLTDMVENSAGVKSQREGITNMEDMLKLGMSNQPDNSDYWIKPLAAYTDSLTGSKLMAGMPARETQAQRNDKNLNAMDDLQKRKGELSKAVMEGVTKLKSGSDTTQQNQMVMNALSQMQGNMNASKYGDPEDRMAFQAHQRNIQALKKDTNIRQNLSNFQRIENGLNNSVSADKLTNESFHELQQAIRTSITRGSGGVDERNATYYGSFNMDTKKLLQYLDSKPQSLNKNDPFVQHVLQLGQLELNNLKRQNEGAAKLLLGGNASMYADPRYAHYKSDLEDLYGQVGNTFTAQVDPKVNERLPKKKGQAGGGMPPPPAQGGDDLNADLGKMTPDQLKAWLAKHG